MKRRRASLFLVGMVAGLGLWLSSDTSRAAVPVPSPVYEIEAVSGTHHASIANLPLGQPGVPQAPVPVDVDGDLLPDVTVAVNLIDAFGLFNNPPQVGEVIAPNVEINRLLTTPILGQKNVPLRIVAKLKINDANGGPSTTLGFGYDTGPGGSIPTKFKAVVGGLEQFFNPLQAIVDTGPGFNTAPTYRGPLKVLGSIATSGLTADLDFGFRPFPDQVRFTYGDDDTGQHITYAHSASREVDLDAHVALTTSTGKTVLDGRIDRLPSSIGVDIADDGEGGGQIAYHATSDGRLPDADVHLASDPNDASKPPLFADIRLTSIPTEITAAWSLPEEGPTSVTFDGSGIGLGAVDVDIRDYEGTNSAMTPFVPTEQQFLAVQQNATGRHITGRVERVRHAGFTDADGLLHVDAQIGDGELPLQVRYDCQAACSTDPESTLDKVDVTATAAPLPDEFSIDIAEAGTDQRTQPMAVTYTSSQLADVDGSIKLTQQGAPGGAISCGALKTVCADLKVRDLPTYLQAKLGRYEDPNVESDLRVALEHTGAVPGPDVFAHVTLGPTDPADPDPRPLVADATALGIPQHARVYVHQHWDDEAEAMALDHAQFHACAQEPTDTTCAPDTQGHIGAIKFGLANFMVRPAGFPIAAPDDPMSVVVTGRGKDFEVVADADHVGDLQFLNEAAMTGVFAQLGNGQHAFGAHLDLEDTPLGDDYALSDEIILDAATHTLKTDATVTPLPSEFGVCFRTANDPLGPDESPYTERCRDNPFDDPDDPVEPMAIHYGLSGTADVEGTFSTTVEGTRHTDQGDEHYGETMRGTADVPQLPTDLTAHIRLPEKNTKGPVQAKYEADSQVDVTFGIEKTVNDATCLDPRVEARALCVSGTVENIPETVDVSYDPTQPTNNFHVGTTNSDPNADPVNLVGLRLSSVAPNSEDPTKASILIADGSILGLPTAVSGTIDVPEDRPDGPDPDKQLDPSPVNVTIEADDPDEGVGTIDLTARNFVTPDPLPKTIPAQRTVFGDPNQALPDPDQTVVLLQRGSAFQATLHIENLNGIGYRDSRDADGNRLDGKQLLLAFAPGANSAPVVRMYADLNAGSGSTYADITLQHLPRRTEVCFRGKGGTTAVDPTYCDEAGGDDGAIEVRTDQPGNAAPDIDAFFRTSSGGADILAARAVVDDLPEIVRGTFPAGGNGTIDMGGYKQDPAHPDDPDALLPDPITAVDAELASFDIDDGFHAGDRPFKPRYNTITPFPAPGAAELGTRFVSVVATDQQLQVKGHLEGLQRVQLRNGACATPGGSADPANRADYPYYPDPASFPPTDEPTKYTCFRGDFAPGTVDDLGLHAHVEADGQQIDVDKAGLTNVPDWVQMTIADSPALDAASQAFRPRCGHNAPDPGTHCTPPMVRFDSDDTSPMTPQLFGRFRVGTVGDLALLDDVTPGTTIPGFDVEPVPSANGVRAKVQVWDGEDPEHPESSVAAQIGFRFDVPHSMTIDRVQSWSKEVGSDEGPEHKKSSDIKFHYIVRDEAGNPVGSLGDLQGLIVLPNGAQMLIRPPTLTGDIQIPGEMGMDIYLRDDPWEGRQFIQLDGRLSAPLSLAATILKPAKSIGRVDAEVLHLPGLDSNTAPGDPTFRVQVELFTSGEKDATDDEETCSVLYCATTNVKVKDINAAVDLAPADGQPQARLVKVVARVEGSANGVQIAGYPSVHDINVNNGGAEGTAPISAWANVVVDPLQLDFHAGIPLVGEVNLNLDATINAAISMTDTADFQMRQNLMHVEAHQSGAGPNSKATVGPLNMNIYNLHGDAWALLAPLFSLDFFPTYDIDATPAHLGVFSCQPFNPIDYWSQNTLPVGLNDGVRQFLSNVADDGGNYIEVQNGETDVLFWPFDDVRVDSGGILGDLVDFLEPIAEPFFCLASATPQDLPLITDDAPADPVVDQTHAVPGYEFEAPPAPDEPPVQPTPEGAQPGVYTTDTALCGPHVYTTLDISAHITVATAPATMPDPNDPSKEIVLCDADHVGRLDITATDVVIHPGGSIDASSIIHDATSYNWLSFFEGFNVTPGSGFDDWKPHLNRGGGHVQFGGAPSYPDTTFCSTPSWDYCNGGDDGWAFVADELDVKTGPGMPGANFEFSGGGAAGGVIVINAETVKLEDQASIAANASAGNAGFDNSCGIDTEWGDVGAGGGAGGGIVVNALKLTMEGSSTISANGGNGGSGSYAGGAGSAGQVKILSPVRTGVTPGTNVTANHGQRGFGSCANAPGNGVVGDPPNGLIIQDKPVDSRALPVDRFWNPGTVDVQYLAGGQPDANNDTFEVLLCGAWLPPEATDLSFDMPPANGHGVTIPEAAGDYCGGGRPPIHTLNFLNHDTYTGQDVVRQSDNAELTAESAYWDPGAMTPGYWGIWTVAVRSQFAGNSCLSNSDFPIPDPEIDEIAINQAFDDSFCTWENVPPQPDIVIGIDNQEPTADNALNPIVITPNVGQVTDHNGNPVYATNHRDLAFVTPAVDTLPNSTDPTNSNARVPLSGILSSFCFDEGVAFFDCTPAAGGVYSLEGGDGVKHIRYLVQDRAANLGEGAVDILLDTKAPTANLVPTAPPDLDNGWYSTTPGFTLHAFDDGPDPAASSGPDPNVRFRWGVDGGPLNDCDGATTCTIPASQLPQEGEIIIRYTAVDAAGNELVDDDSDDTPPMQTFSIKVDHSIPLVDVRTAPDETGPSGWFTTSPWVGLSAFDKPVDGSGVVPGENDTEGDPGIFYQVVTNGQPVGQEARFEAPFPLGPGVHQICYRAVDVAGNDTGVPVCSNDIKVDTVAPTTSLTAAPVAPNGQNGWYVTNPVVTVTASDGAGSGLAPNGLFVSVDGGAYAVVTGSLTIPEGVHLLRAYAVDVAGNQGPVVERTVLVDRSHPVTTARTFPSAPAWAPWFRAEPLVVLRATDGDQNAGVDRIEYKIDNGSWQTYTVPFTVTDGFHTVSYRAFDRSGSANDEAVRTLSVRADITPPIPTALKASPSLWIRLLGPANAALTWNVSDDQTGPVKVTVLVYDVVGNLVRNLDAGMVQVQAGQTTSGSTNWNGKYDNGGPLVPIGVYHFRVLATDAAGNVAQGGESKPIQIKLL